MFTLLCDQWKTISWGVYRKRMSWAPHGRMRGSVVWFINGVKWRAFPSWLPNALSLSILSWEKSHCVLSKANKSQYPEFLYHIEVEPSSASSKCSACFQRQSTAALWYSCSPWSLWVGFVWIIARATWPWREDVGVQGVSVDPKSKRVEKWA